MGDLSEGDSSGALKSDGKATHKRNRHEALPTAANIITCKYYYGGIFMPTEDTLEYMDGSCLECSLNIYELTLEKVADMGKNLYGHESAICFYLIKGVGFQILCDDETMEECRIEGVTHGVIEMYYDGDNLQETNVSIDLSDKDTLRSNFEGEVKVSDIIVGNMTNVDIDSDDNEFEVMCWSEPEEIIDNQEAGSSDDEFIDVQEKKKQWISNRNNSGKNQIMKDKEEVVKNQRSKGIKDDYWGQDGDDYELIHHEKHFYDRESDDEGPLGLSDDEENLNKENLEVHGNKSLLYDHDTPFGSVQIVLGQLYDTAEVLRKALIYYSCQTNRAWNYCLNDSKRVLVKCKFYPKCKWKLSARYTKDYGCLQIRFFKDIHTCAQYWDVNGIPCEHAITAICSKNENPESYVSFWYSKEAYEASYAFSLEPLNGQSMWKKVDRSKILPSDPRVKYGRPPNKRKRSYGDVKRKAYTYRIPKSGKQMCSNCKEVGHKSRKCKYKVPVAQDK